MVTAAAPKIPEAIIKQLSKRGILVMPLQGNYYEGQDLIKIEKTANGLYKESLYQVRFVPMTGDIDQE